jgi:hypothetical protein
MLLNMPPISTLPNGPSQDVILAVLSGQRHVHFIHVNHAASPITM